VSPLKLRLKRRAGYPKLCLCDHSLRASWLQEIIPIIPDELRRSAHLSDLAGHMAESIAGYFLAPSQGWTSPGFPSVGRNWR
jgi:hypothetical protein